MTKSNDITDAELIAGGMYAIADALHAIAKAMTAPPDDDTADQPPQQYMDGTPTGARR